MADCTKYYNPSTSIYSSPLPTSSSIRLLRFRKHPHYDGALLGRLQTFRLDNAPPFYAASYAWGERDFSRAAMLCSEEGEGGEGEGEELGLLSSVAGFLGAMAGRSEGKEWWWVDSVCVNLGDEKERSAQVGIMDRIYKRCKRGIVWLGEERAEGDECVGAVAFLRQLAELKSSIESSDVLREQLRDEKFRGRWEAVGRLLARPYFTRVWTLQEFLLPKEVKMYCGEEAISRSQFKEAIYCIHLCGGSDGKLVPRHAFDASWNRRRVHQWYSKRVEGMNLVATLAYLGNHEARDARDRVFSVLGVIRKEDRRLVGRPDYGTGVQQVFAGLVRQFWAQYQSLDIMCFSHLFNRWSGNMEEGDEYQTLPTWAPDWRAYVQSSPVPLMASQSASEHIGNFRPLQSQSWKAIWDAPGSTLRRRVNVRFHENLKEMWCDGVLLDTVDGLAGIDGCETRCRANVCKSNGHAMIDASELTTPSNDKTVMNFLDIVRTVARCLSLDRGDKYMRFQAPEQYVSDFLMLCYRCMYEEEAEVDPLFKTWFDQNRRLAVAGIRSVAGSWRLEDVIKNLVDGEEMYVFDDLPPPSGNLQLSSSDVHGTASSGSVDRDSFLDRFQDTVQKKSRRLLITGKGHFGMAPCRARQGDAVVILFGCSIPLVLRRVGSREALQVVGECYVDGFMNGQIRNLIEKDRLSVRRFRLV
ncbi:hypothetical protein EJ04DRAFT_547954 [Polyplosphaeria fusca]|uniref:Heterokaryon incompatibility domain-containing protein n=1 Tax=Polyplosphaeria fusca TaxID=682080 RepID=A0A9P4R8H8_9PLEO|nr:hypothetical protein EJ04DRAFT_547954 [Polyplosphaeria fusca]